MNEVPVITELPAPAKSVLKKIATRTAVVALAAAAVVVVYLKVTSSDNKETVNETTS